MLGLVCTPSHIIGLVVVIAAMVLVILFNRQIARVTSYQHGSSPRFAGPRMLMARAIVVLWASTVIIYALLWLSGLVNPDA